MLLFCMPMTRNNILMEIVKHFLFYNAFPFFSLYMANIRLYIRIYRDFEDFEDPAKENC